MRARAMTWYLVATGLLVTGLIADTLVLGIGDRVIDRWATSWSDRVDTGVQMRSASGHAETIFWLEQLDATFPARHAKHALDTERERLLLTLGLAYEAGGRNKKARRTLRRLVDFDPRNFHNHRHLAALLRRQGRTKDAEDALREALAIHPSHLPTVDSLIELLFAAEKFDEVTEAWRAYLDAVTLADVEITHRGRSVVTAVPVDGQFHETRFQLFAAPGDSEPVALRSGGDGLQIGISHAIVPAKAGRARPTEGVQIIAADAWQPTASMQPLGEHSYRCADDDAALTTAVPDRGIATLLLRIRLPVPVGPVTWKTVSESYGAIGDALELEAARKRILLTSGGTR